MVAATLRFVKKNIVAVIALILAAVSVFFVPVNKGYLAYFNMNTLLLLFSTMLVIGAFKNIKTFIITARSLIKKMKNTRALVFSLVFITYIASIFIANDMALLTFLPLTFIVFKTCEKEKYIAFTVIMQTVGANLGGMIMPFGNPQSLYLYSHYNIPVAEFVRIMAPPFLFSLGVIALVCLFVKKEPAALLNGFDVKLNKPRFLIYCVFAVIALLSVFRVINYLIATAIILAGIFIADKKAYNRVDYSLMITFVAFFVFANNMARLEPVREFVTRFTDKNALLAGVISCQLISNVPSAIFLSNFTDDYASLLLATNIGGVGTLVASLASLISLKAFSLEYPNKTKRYTLTFGIINFAFLTALTALCYALLY
ncbi:MAG: SLC13 family permease [Christensenellales bacterium]|jgi:Na+/H+ antiporter NhaD/arsenite permease-like protein